MKLQLILLLTLSVSACAAFHVHQGVRLTRADIPAVTNQALTEPQTRFESTVVDAVTEKYGDEWAVDLDDAHIDILLGEMQGDMEAEACDARSTLHNMPLNDVFGDTDCSKPNQDQACEPIDWGTCEADE